MDQVTSLQSPGTQKLTTMLTSNLYSLLLLWNPQLNITAREINCTDRAHISVNVRGAFGWQSQHELQRMADVMIKRFRRIPKNHLMTINCPTPKLLRWLLDQHRPGQSSRYSDWLRDGRSGDRIPVRGEIFRTCPHRSWGPPSLLYNGYRLSPGVKERPGREAEPSPLSSAVVMKE
jgi:hypothetical protein